MKKVLAIIDVPKWAMHNRVLALKKFLNDKYTFDTKLYNEIYDKRTLNSYDTVYVLNWVLHKHLKNILDKPKNRNYKLVSTVCSHGGRKSASDLRDVFSYYDRISASSLFLYKDLKDCYGTKIVYTPFGVDDTVFKEKVDAYKRIRKYGFVGKTNRSLKRYSDIQSAIKSSRSFLKTADHLSGLGQRQMSDFYNEVGTVVCFSESEGTPNPVLEGASCGRVILSSPVGNVPELFGRSYPLKMVRSRQELVDAMISLNKNPELMRECSAYLKKMVDKKWSWRHQKNGFRRLL